MKTALFLLTLIASILVSSIFKNELEFANNLSGTAVIAAKSAIKGGDQLAMVLPKDLSMKQAELLSYAYQVAKEDGNSHPEKYQGVLYQESKAGGLKGYQVAGQEFGLKPMERYYGVPQLKLVAAKAVFQHYPDFEHPKTDEEIIAKLITDDKWAIRVGSKYFMLVGQNPVAYNKGPGGAQGINPSTDHYAQSVAKHVSTVVKSVNSVEPKTKAYLKLLAMAEPKIR